MVFLYQLHLFFLYFSNILTLNFENASSYFRVVGHFIIGFIMVFIGLIGNGSYEIKYLLTILML